MQRAGTTAGAHAGHDTRHRLSVAIFWRCYTFEWSKSRPQLDAGDTSKGGAAGPPAGVKTEESAAVMEEVKPRLIGQKRVKGEDESDDSDVRPVKTAKKEEDPAEALKPVAVPRVGRVTV